MRIVVLGASGQIGSTIYDGLKNMHAVVGTSRHASDKYIRFDPFQKDWTVLRKADILINCVGQIEATNTSSFYHIHIALTKQILEHRQQIGNPGIIQISALGASTEHQVEFLRTKGIADDLLLQHPDTIVIRPSIVCTHRTMIVRKLIMLSTLGRLLFGVVPVPKGFLQTRIQPIMPDDLVDVVRKMCSDRNPRIVDAVGPAPINFQEIIQIMMESRQQKLKMIEVSKALSDVIVKNFFSRLFPKIINWQQYELLFEDNVAGVETTAEVLGRPLRSTRDFFKNEFAYAAN